jgi:uncharacterized protein
MFKRRTARSLFTRIFSFLWPRMGWRRAISYYWHRLKRIPGTPESIAMGFACGAAASMMPFMGFHFVLSAVLAWLLRGSIIASAIGTVVGNPWTFPFIWVGTYEIGKVMIGIDHAIEGEQPFLRMFGGLYQSIRTFDGDLFVDRVMPTLVPMLAGSIPVSVSVGVLSYFLVLKPIRAVHKLRLERNIARSGAEATTKGGR